MLNRLNFPENRYFSVGLKICFHVLFKKATPFDNLCFSRIFLFSVVKIIVLNNM